DTINGDMFKHNKVSHGYSPLLDGRTCFLICQDEKTYLLKISSANAWNETSKWAVGYVLPNQAVICCQAGRQEQGIRNSAFGFQQASAPLEASHPERTACLCP